MRLRWRQRLGPVQIAGRLGMPASTVHAVLVRCRINRLARIDRVTGEPMRRYEHDHPGSLIHVDVTKFGNIPDGGGWRYVGRQQGDQNKSSHRAADRPHGQGLQPADRHRVRAHRHRRPLPGRLRRDLRRREGRHRHRRPAPSRRLVRRPRRHRRTGPVRQRLLPTGPTPGATPAPNSASRHKRTRPYRPQTNGKIERFHRTLADGWAYARFYDSEARPPSTPCPAGSTSTITTDPTPPSAGKPPISRLTNLPGHHTSYVVAYCQEGRG